MTLLIGFSGRARHGKTACCEAIQHAAQADGKTARLYDIGNIIRLYCIKNGLLPRVERRDITKEQLQILIDVGKQKRAVDEGYWIHQMFGAIATEQPDVALVPNLRYWNEVDATKKSGGYVVRVTRLTGSGTEFISPDRDPNDVSETSLDHCWETDFYITTKDKNEELVGLQAVALYQYLKKQQCANACGSCSGGCR
jgi:hypothetical protein